MLHFIHLIHAPMAFHATDAAADMYGMVKIDVLGNLVDLHPGNGGIIGGAVAHDLQAGIILKHLIVAVHARRGAGQVGKPGFFHAIMAVAAVHTQLPRMNAVRERHGLHGLVTGTGVFGREVNRHAGDHATACQCGTKAKHERQPVCPLRKNHFSK